MKSFMDETLFINDLLTLYFKCKLDSFRENEKQFIHFFFRTALYLSRINMCQQQPKVDQFNLLIEKLIFID